MADLAVHAREAQATDISIVFPGDVYDLVRTERWLDHPVVSCVAAFRWSCS